MFALKLCCLLVIACSAIVSAQAQSPTPTSVLSPTTSLTGSASSSDGSTITKEELEAIVAEIKQEVASNAALAAVFDGLDLDALLKMTPEEARKTLNEKVFDATAQPTSSASGSAASMDGSSSIAPSVDGSTSPASQVDGSSSIAPPVDGSTSPASQEDGGSSSKVTSTPTSTVPAPAPAGSAGTRAALASITGTVVAIASTVVYLAW